jgi:hypothetical protein
MASTESKGLTLQTESLDGLHWLGVLAALVTGLIHLLLGFGMFPSGLAIAFLLAGLGFLGAIVLVLLDYRRRMVYGIGIPFTLIQLILWYILNFAGGPKQFPGDIGTLGAIDKVTQLVLVVLLLALLRS